ncbi:MAG: CHAT domain-containing protein, partial [Bacteroidota bacterium]
KETGLDLLRLKAQLFVQFFEQTQEVAHLSKAMTAYRTASEVIGLWRQSVPTAAAKNELAERSSVLYQEAIRTAYRLYEQGKEEQYKDLAFSLAERSKAQLLIELMNERLARGLHNLPDSLLEQDRKLRLDISLCNRQLLKASMQTDETQAEDLTSWRNRRFELQQQLEQLSRQFEANYPDFYQLKYQQEPTDPAVLQKLLADQEQALIEYFMGEEAIYVFVLTARQRELLRLPLSDSLDRQIERLRAAISQIPSDADLADNHRNFTQSAYSLYQQVLASALSTLPTGLASLVIIPDYQLNYLPFELLLERPAAEGTVQFSPAVLDYVLEKYQVSYDYSAVVYGKNCQKESGAYQRDFVGFAPTFGEPTIAELRRGCTLGDLGALQCNGEEVTRIGKLMGGQISLGEQANRAQFEDLLLGSRIVHLATHACVKEDRGGHNKIFLSDDYVSENDLFGRLTNAELIVLSACNSGSGQLLRGEGVMSLARGFLQAGSASCVLSRWSVDDCATSEIMTRLYEGLQAGQTRTEALRGAKLAFVESAEKYQQHPFFWGAFILYGRADRLSLYSSGWPWHRYLLLCLLLGMLGLGWARFRR